MDSPHGAAVKAEGFGLKGPRGWVFQDIAIDAAPGSLLAVEGPSGSGRTCLLLALTGRMKPTAGHAEIGRHRLPKKMAAVRRIAALGPVPGVNDLDQALTVAEQLREGAMLQRRYDAPLRSLLRRRGAHAAPAPARIEQALAAAGLDPATLPKGPRTSVRDLERLEAVRLSVAIALLSGPRLLALDDLDLKLSDAERAEAWTLLRSVAARGTTVLAVCSEAPGDVTVIRTGPRTQPEPAPKPAAASPSETPKVTWGTSRPEEAHTPADPQPHPAAPSLTKAAPGAQAAPGPVQDGRTDGTGEDADEGTGADTDDADTDDADTDDEDTKGADDALAETGRA